MSIDLKNLQPNVPAIDISQYAIVLAGVAKAGKTTLFAEMVEKYFNDTNKGLILALEKGYSALRTTAQDIENWDDFEEAVDQLVEEKDELPFKMIGIDTVDILWNETQLKVIEEWNKQNPALRTQDINAVGAKKKGGQGFGVGYNRAKSKIRKQIDRLQKAGYGVIAITHSKEKRVEEKGGLEYDQLKLSLPQSAQDIFVNMADFINFITIEKEKVGDEINTNRYIYFRSDGFVEAGSRFPDVPQRIEYDVDNYIKTIEDAIKARFGNDEDINKIKEEQDKQEEKEANEFVEKEKEEIAKKDELESKTDDELQNELKNIMNKFSKENKETFKERLSNEVGASKPSELDTKEKKYNAIQIAKSIE